MKYKLYVFFQEVVGPVLFAVSIGTAVILTSFIWVPLWLITEYFSKEEERYRKERGD